MTHRPVRVLYVLNSIGGGASLGLYEMVRKLPRDQFDPYAVLPGDVHTDLERIRPLFADVRIIPMPFWNLRPDAGLARRTAFRLARWRRGVTFRASRAAIAKAIEDWNVDIVHSGTALTLGGALAARDKSIPHVWHIKECIGRKNRVQFPMSDRDLVNYMSRLSAWIVVMSNYIGNIFREHGCRNWTVSPDVVDTEPYESNAPGKLREEMGLTSGNFLIGMIASLTSVWKRHDVFIRMAGLLAKHEPKAHFLLIGPRPSPSARWPYDLAHRHYGSLMHLTRECGLEGRLSFHDYIPDPPDIMRSLDVLVHTCDVEPFGRVAIEAMAAGTPVVGPTTGGISETVVHGQTGLLVTPGDATAFADATQRLLRDQQLREGMGNAGRVHVRQHYPVTRQVEQLAWLYRRILGRGEAQEDHLTNDFVLNHRRGGGGCLACL